MLVRSFENCERSANRGAYRQRHAERGHGSSDNSHIFSASQQNFFKFFELQFFFKRTGISKARCWRASPKWRWIGRIGVCLRKEDPQCETRTGKWMSDKVQLVVFRLDERFYA